MIKSLDLKNFTIFDHLKIDFSSQINVIIGENGTGKTHLLKAGYALCQQVKDDEDLDSFVTDNLIKIFLPLNDKLGKLHRLGASENAQLGLIFDTDEGLSIRFHNNSRTVAVEQRGKVENPQIAAVFIPTKEVISLMKGFVSLYGTYQLSFDKTFQHICLLLDLPSLRPETLPEKSRWAIAEIEKICGGHFIFYGGGNVTFQTPKSEYSANVIAEGFRKLGLLSRLLETGAIQPGVSGPLFWDEPGVNLNPKLMQLLVQILLELARSGQQIILATHDYVLLKWFDLLSDQGQGDRVRYHSLYRNESEQIQIHSTDNYLEIEPNPIADSYLDLTRVQLQQKLRT